MIRSIILFTLLSLAGCEHDYENVAGSVSGLADGASFNYKVAVDDNFPSDHLTATFEKTGTIDQNGDFETEAEASEVASWEFSITGQPDGQTCTATGNISNAGTAVRDGVLVDCVSNEVVLQGTVVNLAEGSILVLSATPTNEDLTVTEQGSIAFEQPVDPSDEWAVTVKTHPEGYYCQATDGNEVGYSSVYNVPDGINYDCSFPAQ